MTINELRQKIMDSADRLLTYSFLVHGEGRQILDALRIYVASEMSDAELTKVLNHLQPKP